MSPTSIADRFSNSDGGIFVVSVGRLLHWALDGFGDSLSVVVRDRRLELTGDELGLRDCRAGLRATICRHRLLRGGVCATLVFSVVNGLGEVR